MIFVWCQMTSHLSSYVRIVSIYAGSILNAEEGLFETIRAKASSLILRPLSSILVKPLLMKCLLLILILNLQWKQCTGE